MYCWSSPAWSRPVERMDLTDLYAQPDDELRRAAGGLQALIAVGPQQCLEPEAAAVALFGVGPAVEELFDERGCVRSPLAPGDQSGRSPPRMRAVRGGHVRPFGRVAASPMDPEVRGDGACGRSPRSGP